MVIKIIVNDKDISEDFKKYFLDLQIIDKDGTESDELNFTVSYAIKRPKYEDKIKIWINNVFYGAFLVQSTTTNHINELIVRATGTNFSSSIKTKKSRNFAETSLKAIVEQIARENGLKSNVDFSDVSISNIIQSNESDMHFLTRLAKDYDAIFSIKNNTLIFLERDTSLPNFTINLNQCSIWDITYTDKKVYSSCLARYRSTKENAIQTVTIGVGTPILSYQEAFQTKEEATKKATAKLQRAKRGTKEGRLTIEGVYISAGSTITLVGSTQDNGDYTAETVTTNVNMSGWVVDVDFKN